MSNPIKAPLAMLLQEIAELHNLALIEKELLDYVAGNRTEVATIWRSVAKEVAGMGGNMDYAVDELRASGVFPGVGLRYSIPDFFRTCPDRDEKTRATATLAGMVGYLEMVLDFVLTCPMVERQGATLEQMCLTVQRLIKLIHLHTETWIEVI